MIPLDIISGVDMNISMSQSLVHVDYAYQIVVNWLLSSLILNCGYKLISIFKKQEIVIKMLLVL